MNEIGWKDFVAAMATCAGLWAVMVFAATILKRWVMGCP